MITPWDNQAKAIVNMHPIDTEYHPFLIKAIVSALSKAYSKGYDDGGNSERRNPHREDMGR